MRGAIKKQKIGSVSVCGPAHEGESSILDQTVEETNWQNTLDYAKDVYKFSFNPPLASIQGRRDKAFASFRDHVPKWLGPEREKHKQNCYDALQAHFKKKIKRAHEEAVPKALAVIDFATGVVDSRKQELKRALMEFMTNQYEKKIKRAHEEAVPKALAVIDFATGVVDSRKQELKRALMEFMTNQYEGFEDAQCRRAMERALDVFNSVLNSPKHTMSDTLKEPIGSVTVHKPVRQGKNQSVIETDCQNALDHAKDVYKSLFKSPLVVHEAHLKSRAAFNDVAVGAGGAGSIRKKYKHILRDIRYKAYQDLLKKSHEEAALNALAAFDSRVGAVGCAEQQYKSRLEDFMKNEYEGFEEAECKRIMARVREILRLPPDALI